jgi:hypothetical protein
VAFELILAGSLTGEVGDVTIGKTNRGIEAGMIAAAVGALGAVNIVTALERRKAVIEFGTAAKDSHCISVSPALLTGHAGPTAVVEWLAIAPCGRAGAPLAAVSVMRSHEASAQSCVIGSGKSCVRGLRMNDVVLERVSLIVPPKSGNVQLIGPGFRYTANPDFTEKTPSASSCWEEPNRFGERPQSA